MGGSGPVVKIGDFDWCFGVLDSTKIQGVFDSLVFLWKFYNVGIVCFIMRIRFLIKGGQRAFLDEVITKLKSPSLRGLLQFGFDVKYSTLKNYYAQARLMPKELVEDFCGVGGIDFAGLGIEEVLENWGKVKGGKFSKRK